MLSVVSHLRKAAVSGSGLCRCIASSSHRYKKEEGWLGRRLTPDYNAPERYDHIYVDTDVTQRPMKNNPFIKTLFVGEYDERMLVFPEVCEKEELEDLEAMVEPIERFFDNLDSTAIDREAQIPEDVLETMKSLGLFGLQIPEKYGGLNLNATKYARIAEITGRDGALSVTLAAHQSIGLKGILIAGNEEQKAKYLPRLATGEQLAAFALTEPSSGSDAQSIKAQARLTPDGKHYLINGSKIWITNGGLADVFTVFAKTPVRNEEGDIVDKVTAFIAERDFGGITHGKPEDKLGIRGSNTCEVHFEDCPVPVENVLGTAGGGFKVAMNILNSGRFSMGTSCAGALKKLIAQTMDHALTRKQFDKEIIEFDAIRYKFSQMAVAVYAMESMSYHTAGIIDAYQEPDCSLEAAAVKIYSSENTWWIVSECLQILGGLGYMKDYPYERYLRDARILPIFEGTNEILRMYIALTGLDYAGIYYTDVIKRMRDPLNNIGYILGKYFQRNKDKNLKKSTMLLHEHVHPVFDEEARHLESFVKQIRSCIEDNLTLYRRDIVDKQQILTRLTDSIIDIFGMTAVLARASRSISIGLPDNQDEMNLCLAFCYDASIRLKRNIEEMTIDNGKVTDNADEIHRHIASKMVKEKGCFAASPLDRTW